ncbi:anti-sigma factor domain-containing protein, partial [Vallitalea okinawensis]|uniref:anti-sigma factor domain-containing protein n=1 Tax=Vallitalea okinawensis TaxID=2078660 RepID=UPI0013005695
MMRQGMVLKLNHNYALIATDDAEFIKIKYREGMYVGQKIFVLEEDIIYSVQEGKRRPNYLKVIATLAACIVIAIILNSSFMRDTKSLYAIISIDINPSFELGINESYNVVQINAKNEESKSILNTNLIGQPLTVAVSEILSDVEESGYALESDNALLISTVNLKNNKDETIHKGITDGVLIAIEEEPIYENTKVIFIDADEEDLKTAEELGLSIGKYRLIELSNNKIDKSTIEKERVTTLIEEEEIKENLEDNEAIEIIDAEVLQRLNEIDKEIERLKNRVEQVEDALDRRDYERTKDIFDYIQLMDNGLINEENEFNEIQIVLDELYQLINIAEEALAENLEESYEEDDLIEEEGWIEEEDWTEEDLEEFIEEEDWTEDDLEEFLEEEGWTEEELEELIEVEEWTEEDLEEFMEEEDWTEEDLEEFMEEEDWTEEDLEEFMEEEDWTEEDLEEFMEEEDWTEEDLEEFLEEEGWTEEDLEEFLEEEGWTEEELEEFLEEEGWT